MLQCNLRFEDIDDDVTDEERQEHVEWMDSRCREDNHHSKESSNEHFWFNIADFSIKVSETDTKQKQNHIHKIVFSNVHFGPDCV